MSNLTPGCLACLMDSDGGFGDCIDASAAVCVAADEDATNALWLRVLSGERIEQSDLMAALSSGCSLAVMTGGGPAALTCARACGARGPPLPPLTTCDEFTAAMATGGCAETCGGASGAYSAEVLQAATDIACPGGGGPPAGPPECVAAQLADCGEDFGKSSTIPQSLAC